MTGLFALITLTALSRNYSILFMANHESRATCDSHYGPLIFMISPIQLYISLLCQSTGYVCGLMVVVFTWVDS